MATTAFDPATGKMVLFGGLAGPANEPREVVGDTWTWDGKHWSPVHLTSGPVARTEANMAYDPVRRVVVMRGGCCFLDETWTWDGSRWLLVSPARAAPVWILGGGDEPLTWDSQRQVVLLYAYTRFLSWGGTDISEANQVWAWDGIGWTQVQTNGDAPNNHGLSPAGIAYDSTRHNLVFFGHDNATGDPRTWILEGSSWRLASTVGPGDRAFTMAGDEARSNIVYLGQNGDTWTWDGTRWTAQNPVHSPGLRYGQAMAYDSQRRVVTIFGGYGMNDTWTWNGTDWTQVA